MNTLLAAVFLLAALALAAWSLWPMVNPHAHPRWASDEQAAISLLKTSVFSAQIVFQAQPARDRDGDGVGEFGLLAELRANPPAAGCLSGGLAQAEVSNRYRFAVFLPDGAGGAIGEAAGAAPRSDGAAAVQAQERRFRAYAWPDVTDGGRRMFCLDERGYVLAQPWDGRAPGWDAVTGGKGWEAPALWTALR